MRVVVVTPPARVVSVEDAKEHLKVQYSADDVLIGGMIDAAQGHIDGPDAWLGRSIGAQTLEYRGSAFPPVLPYGPVLEILSVKHLDLAGVETVLTSARYESAGDVLAAAWGSSWPAVHGGMEPVRIQYRAGYNAVPPAIRNAILLMVGDLYRHRGETVVGMSVSSVPMSTTVERMLWPFQRLAV